MNGLLKLPPEERRERPQAIILKKRCRPREIALFEEFVLADLVV
jgi:hypothetical protein